MDICSLIKEQYVLAHKNENNVETLKEHIDKCINIYDKFNKELKIEDKIRNTFKEFSFSKDKIEKNFLDYEIDLIIEMVRNVVRLHDIGKINPKFQVNKLENNLFKNVKNIESMESYHSLISSYVYINEFYPYIKKCPNNIMLAYIMLNFANLIYCHHTGLKDFNKLFNKDGLMRIISFVNSGEYLTNYLNPLNFSIKLGSVIDSIEKEKYGFDTMTLYIINKLVFSTLISIDFTATYCFFEGVDTKDITLNRINDIQNIKDKFYSSKIMLEVEKYKKDKDYFINKGEPINELRSDIMLESLNKLINNKDKDIFNIESPTGSGKTLNSLNCSINLLNKDNNKLINMRKSILDVLSSYSPEGTIKLCTKMLNDSYNKRRY